MIDVLNQSGNGGVEETCVRMDNKAVAVRHEDLFGGHDNERVGDLYV